PLILLLSLHDALPIFVLGNGVCAAVNLNKSKAQGADWIVIALGWGLGVTMGAYVGGTMGPAHLNPAVTIAFACIGLTKWAAVVPDRKSTRLNSSHVSI